MPCFRVARWVLLLLPCLASTALAETDPIPAASRIPATLLRDSPSLTWPERQFVQADKEGRVFLLRAETLELFAVTSAGGLDPKGRLEGATQTGESLPIDAAALSAAGDLWVLSLRPNRLEVFQSGKLRESVDCPWLVSGVAAPAGEPIASVLPGVMSSATNAGTRPAPPPALARWDGKSWNSLLAGTFGGRARVAGGSAGSVEGVGLLEQLRGEHSRVLAGAPGGALWIADRYAYRVRALSPLGVVRDELKVGEGKVVWAERSKEEWKHLEALAKREGFAFDRGSLSRVRAQEVVRAMTLGRDGALYLLVAIEGGLALDRFDPALVRLDRLGLTGLEGVPGTLTLAAGTDGLYVAAPSGRLGLWRVDREALEKAEWKPVAGATLDGQPLDPAGLREMAASRAEAGAPPATARPAASSPPVP